jgi:hypothetical protein
MTAGLQLDHATGLGEKVALLVASPPLVTHETQAAGLPRATGLTAVPCRRDRAARSR